MTTSTHPQRIFFFRVCAFVKENLSLHPIVGASIARPNNPFVIRREML